MNGLIFIGESDIHGKGVIAKIDLPKGTTFICDVLLIKKIELKYIKKTKLLEYLYPWDKDNSSICCGFGSFFNHSNNPNTKIISIDKVNKTKTFITLSTIKKNSELTIKYGNSNFNASP